MCVNLCLKIYYNIIIISMFIVIVAIFYVVYSKKYKSRTNFGN